MESEEQKGNSSADSRNSEAACGWSGDELQEIPAICNCRAVDRIIGMSEAEMRNASLIFAIIILFFTASGIVLSRFASDRARLDLAQCVQIAKNADRLSCYDKAALSGESSFRVTSPFSTMSASDLDKPG